MAEGKGPVLELDVQFASGDAPVPDGADFENWISSALCAAAEEVAGEPADGAIALRLVGIEEGAALNSTWRQKAGATNVLAFPGPAAIAGSPVKLPAGLPVEYGDLVICLPVVAREAAEQGKSPVSHLAHLVIHGTLHLIGYTHDGEPDTARMEALETRILKGFGIPDPYVMK